MQPEILPESWRAEIGEEMTFPYFERLGAFLETERAEHTVFPPEEDVFNAFAHTDFDDVKVVILGQDPYHDDGQAHGLCFSVQPGVKIPPSLRNIYKELHSDLGCDIPDHGCLTSWAEQGVFLLNTVLTVRAHTANSHKKKGWENFTGAAIEAIAAREKPVVFILWGRHAQAKKELIDSDRHAILESAHPSPLSAKNGFFGSKPFSTANEHLRNWGQTEIDWQVPPL